KINSETMLHFLEEKGFYISSGSACSKGKKSHVLEAMNLQKNEIETAIRISFCKENNLETITYLAQQIKNAVKTLVKAF
ncbi:MAG: aminotransferase class V-fold PLP-dependent enzyme, partial [Oscillospiraceae bacterium]